MSLPHAHPQVRLPTPLPTASFLVSDAADQAWASCNAVRSRPACAERGVRTAQRVAVCLTGAARTFVRPHITRAFSSNLIDALQARTVDVFAVMRATDVDAKRQASYDHERLDASPQALAMALAAVKPRAVSLDRGNPNETAYGVPYNADCTVSGFMGESRNHLMRSIAQPASWQQCVSLITRAEQLDGAAYDWVIRTRADLFWFFRHPPVCALAPRVAYMHHWVDHHFILPRRRWWSSWRRSPDHDHDDLATAVMGRMIDAYTRCGRGAPAAFPHHTLESWLQATLTAAASGRVHTARCARAPPAAASSGARQQGTPRAGLSTLLFPAALVRNHSGESNAKMAAWAYCVPYVLLGGRVLGANKPAVPPCRGPHEKALQGALATCLRRAYPDERIDAMSTSYLDVSQWCSERPPFPGVL